MRSSTFIKTLHYLFVLCPLLIDFMPASAQSVGKFEAEAGAAIPLTAKKYGSKFEPAWNIYAEGRYNIPSFPADVGLQVQYGAFYRTWKKTGIDKDYRFWHILAVSDYTFRRRKNIAPFVGCGAGFSIVKIDHSTPESMICERNFSACIVPRIGIEFFHHLRLTASYRLMNREYSNLEVSLGIVFGGGRR